MDQQQAQEIHHLLEWWQARERQSTDEPDVPLEQIAIAYVTDRREIGTPTTLHTDTIARILEEYAAQPHVRPARA